MSYLLLLAPPFLPAATTSFLSRLAKLPGLFSLPWLLPPSRPASAWPFEFPNQPLPCFLFCFLGIFLITAFQTSSLYADKHKASSYPCNNSLIRYINSMRRWLFLFLLLPVIPASVFVFTSVPIGIADRLVIKDHIKRANLVYQAKQVFSPHDPQLRQRLLITHALLGYPHPKNLPSYSSTVLGSSASSIPVLEYHYIRRPPNPKNPSGDMFSVSPDNFARQMDYLSTHQYTSLSLSQFEDILFHEATPPARPVLITFDDGYSDLYHEVLPVLKRHSLRATAFVVSGFLDGPNYLTKPELIELDKSGIFDIGSHTISHYSLPLLPAKEVAWEFSESKSQIEKLLGHGIKWLCYPYGLATPQIESLAKETGYVGSFIATPETSQSPADIFHLPRTIVSGKSTLEEFSQVFP